MEVRQKGNRNTNLQVNATSQQLEVGMLGRTLAYFSALAEVGTVITTPLKEEELGCLDENCNQHF